MMSLCNRDLVIPSLESEKISPRVGNYQREQLNGITLDSRHG